MAILLLESSKKMVSSGEIPVASITAWKMRGSGLASCISCERNSWSKQSVGSTPCLRNAFVAICQPRS